MSKRSTIFGTIHAYLVGRAAGTLVQDSAHEQSEKSIVEYASLSTSAYHGILWPELGEALKFFGVSELLPGQFYFISQVYAHKPVEGGYLYQVEISMCWNNFTTNCVAMKYEFISSALISGRALIGLSEYDGSGEQGYMDIDWSSLANIGTGGYRCDHYPDGALIPTLIGSGAWSALLDTQIIPPIKTDDFEADGSIPLIYCNPPDDTTIICTLKTLNDMKGQVTLKNMSTGSGKVRVVSEDGLNIDESPSLLIYPGSDVTIRLFDDPEDPSFFTTGSFPGFGVTHSTAAFGDHAHDDKVDKVEGKGLSTNDLTDVLKTGYDGAVTNAHAAHSDDQDLSGKADLVGGVVPAGQLPSYIDEILEYANLVAFPTPGESGKVYLALDTNLTYRWGGSAYAVLNPSLALGETSTTAYAGDKGKTAYDLRHAAHSDDQDLSVKVDKVTGKGLSTNDLTNTLKSGYDGAVTNAHAAGSDNQDLSGKVDKITGKGLSTNDLTDVLKSGYDGAVTNSHAAHSDDQDLSVKVDKVSGKGLSTNDLTNTLKSGYDGAVTNSHAAGSDNQDLSGKVDKVTGKGLSTNDLTNDLKTAYDGAVTNSHAPHSDDLEETLINHIGVPGHRGFGVGICPQELLAAYNAVNPEQMIVSMNGTYDISSSNYGNYQVYDGSIMVWIPFAWGKKNADNTGDIKPEGYFIDEAAANAAGYFTPRCFINAGIVQRGIFIDKYKASLTGITEESFDGSGSLANCGVASSIKLSNPISSSSESKRTSTDNLFAGSFANCRANGQNPVDNYAGAIDAARSRGGWYHVMTLFAAEWLRFITQVHKQAASGTTFCAFNGVSPSEPRGNNNYGVDYYDSAVAYAACDDAFWGAKTAPMEARKNGGGTPFAKTTHNGQDSGVCLDANQWEFLTGVTCIAESAQAITSITRAAEAVVTVTNGSVSGSNYANGRPVQIQGSLTGEWATLLKDKIFTISDKSGNTFKLKDKSGSYVNTWALSADYSSGLTSLTGKFYMLSETVDLKIITSGVAGFPDMWWQPVNSWLWEEINVDFCGDIGGLLGNGSNQVFSGEVNRTTNAYKLSAAGLPMNKDSYGPGTVLMGNDYCYSYIVHFLAPRGFGSWYSVSTAGVGARHWAGDRADASRDVSFRSGLLIG